MAKGNPRIRQLELVDTQAGGDVSRIVMGGVSVLPGESVLEQMRYLAREADGLRRLLLSEPYGDPAMCVDLVVPAFHPEAAAGYIIMEAMGYPVYSGSNTMCTATALLESGRIPMLEGEQSVTLESPAGLVQVRTENRSGRVVSATCEGSPAFVSERNLQVRVEGFGVVSFDLVFSGAYYAVVNAKEHGFALVREEEAEVIAFAHRFVEAARPQVPESHPLLGEVGPLPFLHLAGPIKRNARGILESPSATYVHPGVLCRSPTGTGTSARLALMVSDGDLQYGEQLETVSPRGNRFLGTALDRTSIAGLQALRSEVTGRAWTLARSQVVVDLDDPLVVDEGLSRILEPLN